MLAAAVIVLSTRPVPEEPGDTIRGLGSLLAVIALLVGVDVWESWRNRRG
jgi:hypothetical protein